MLRGFVLAVALLVACSGRGKTPMERTQANGFNDPGLRLSICGTVENWTPPSSVAEGSLGLDVGSWVIAPTAHVRGVELLVPGADVCLGATLDTERRVVDGDVIEAPTEDPWARLPP